MTMIVNIRNNYFALNDVALKFPLDLAALVLAFGEPSQKFSPMGDRCWGAVWDDLGVLCVFGYYGFDNCNAIQFFTKHWDPSVMSLEFDVAPLSRFFGTFKVNEVVIDHNDFEYFRLGNIGLTNLPTGPYLARNFDYKDKVPSKKYLLRGADEHDVVFSDFNFKLLIIQELMFEQNRIKPLFDLEEFVRWHKQRVIDLDEEEGQLIPEVREYFANLPIPKKWASKIKKIRQDGGNEIYANLIHNWDGENGVFDVLNLEDALHFPLLKEITILETAYWNDEQAVQQQRSKQLLMDKGIEVKFV